MAMQADDIEAMIRAALPDAEINKIGRVLHQHDVARIEQGLADHVEKLLRAMRHHQSIHGVRAGSRLCAVLLPDSLRGQFAQMSVARAGSILQRALSAGRRAQNLLQQLTRRLDRQRGIVSESGGKGDQLRPIQRQLHQPRNRRLFGPASKLGQG